MASATRLRFLFTLPFPDAGDILQESCGDQIVEIEPNLIQFAEQYAYLGVYTEALKPWY